MKIFPDGKRERGLIAYLQGLTYRVTMRIAHRFNWHYAPPIHPAGDTQLWCKWCGFRQTIKKAPPVLLGAEIRKSSLTGESEGLY